MTDSHSQVTSILSLPSEILENVLTFAFSEDGVSGIKCDGSGTMISDQDYKGSSSMAPLLACKQLYLDGNLPAFRRTHFSVTNLYINVPDRLSQLTSRQVQAIRSIALTVDKRHFRALESWGEYAFGRRELDLDELTIVLHQTSQHYLFDFTADVVKLLRNLQGVRRLTFVRNRAHVKGAFKTWCNRLIGLLLKIDHHERYIVQPPNPEQTWWTWGFNDTAQVFSLEACASKPMLDEESYMQQIKPLVESLMLSIESEEWNPDPRTRNGT